METPTKKWARLSFDQMRDEMESLNAGRGFQCIAMPYGSPCYNTIATVQVGHAIAIFQTAGDSPPAGIVRDIIHCGICDKHSQTARQLANVEIAWEGRFGLGFFSDYRTPSPYSRDRKRRTSLMAREARKPDPTPSRQMPPSVRSNDSVPRIHLAPDDTTPARHQRSSSAPVRPSSDVADSSENCQSREAEDVDQDAVSTGSPRAVRRRRPSVEAVREEVSLNEDDAQGATGSSVPPRVQRAPASAGRRSRRLGQCLHDDNFHLGVAYSWAPWTIRSKVIELLQEPIPGPETHGQLYVVRVVTGDTQRYVKIGYTARDVSKRLREISDQHRVKLEVGSVCKTLSLPLTQVTRLEALVHADLAFFQRDLCVVTDQKTAYRVEYFEIDQADAWRTVEMWTSIMHGIGLRPNKALPEAVTQRLEVCANVYERLRDDVRTESEHWATINEHHASRESIWRDNLPAKDPQISGNLLRPVKDWLLLFFQAFSAFLLAILAIQWLPPGYFFATATIGIWALQKVGRRQYQLWTKGGMSYLGSIRGVTSQTD